jgi:hypothetical protein
MPETAIPRPLGIKMLLYLPATTSHDQAYDRKWSSNVNSSHVQILSPRQVERGVYNTSVRSTDLKTLGD